MLKLLVSTGLGFRVRGKRPRRGVPRGETAYGSAQPALPDPRKPGSREIGRSKEGLACIPVQGWLELCSRGRHASSPGPRVARGASWRRSTFSKGPTRELTSPPDGEKFKFSGGTRMCGRGHPEHVGQAGSTPRSIRVSGKFFIEDKQSRRNHTFVNNQIISTRTPLEAQADKIRICDFTAITSSTRPRASPPTR